MQAIELFQEKIAEFQEHGAPAVLPRDLTLPHDTPQIVVTYGMRRTGKTCMLQKTLQNLEIAGINRSQCIWFSMEDERFEPFSTETVERYIECHYLMFPHQLNKPRYIFFDEIQELPNWEKYVRRLSDDPLNHLYLTGSSAKLLSDEIHTSLRGRTLAFKVYPLSFREFLHWSNFDTTRKTKQARIEREYLFNKYFEQGGFPQVYQTEDIYRFDLLKSYFEVMLLRDVIERFSVSNVAAIKLLGRHILRSYSTQLSINKMYKWLKSQAIKISIGTVSEYFDHFRAACFIETIEILTDSVKKAQANPQKVYVVDSGLPQFASPFFSKQRGPRLENLVAIELLRRKGQLNYYKTSAGNEVDFIWRSQEGQTIAIQVCAENLTDQTLHRELRSLQEARDELKPDRSILITMPGQMVKLEDNDIEIISADNFVITP